MKKLATTGLFVLLAALTVQISQAQTVTTVQAINAIPQAGIDAVNALGADVTQNDIVANIRSPFEGETVQFTAVVISDPANSGLSSVNSSTNEPSRVHYYVRDVNAATAGMDGQVVQVVDGNYRTNGSLNLFVGDVATFTGSVAYFGTGMQFSPSSIEFLGTYSDQGLDATILDPVTVTLDQINSVTGDLMVRANWDNFSAMNQQYVRIENLQVYQSPNRTDGRPTWALRDLTTGSLIDMDDISLAFRNDRSDYPSDFNAENDFVAPPVGARVNLQGFAQLTRSSFDPFTIGDPSIARMQMVPWQDSDLEITQSPPNISDVSLPADIPGNNPVTITASIVVDQSRTLTSTELTYSSSDGSTGTVAGVAGSGDTYSFQVPAQTDRAFVTYSITAADSDGATSTTVDRFYRVLFDGITDIRDIQEPAPGTDASPFNGFTGAMDLEVTVMTDPAIANGSSDVMTVQDGISPWSGIALRASSNPLTTAGVVKGDRIRITSATVYENFGFTMLRDYTFESVSTGGSPYADIVVTTDQLQDSDIAESLESMYIRVENVVVLATNADDPSGPFGEFLVSNGSSPDGVRVDDQSDLRSFEGNDPGTVYSEGQRLAFVRGPLWYSFSNWKIEPETTDDIGPVTNTAVEDDVLPFTSELHQNFPNPFNPTTSIRFDVATSGQVTLEVYDTLGRLVDTLVNGQRAAGTHSVQFNASQLSSGLYLYRLHTADATVTRTMTLLK